jgi:hypothetical protein
MREIKINTQFTDNNSFPEQIPITWLTHLFGCWHSQMGNPFTRGDQTYCTCRECGACRKFDMAKWKSVGPYFYNPILELYDEIPMKTEPILSNFKLAE